MSIYLNTSFLRLLQTTSAAALVWTALVSGSTIVFAQTTPVTVDLSVLNDSGYGPATIPGYAGGSAKLLMPGPIAPQSSYFGPDVNVASPVVSIPTTSDDTQLSSQEAMSSTLSAADIVPPPEPEPMQVPAEPVMQETATAMTSEIQDGVSKSIPEAPTEDSKETASTATEAVALQSEETESPPPPPAAPETMEVETAAAEAETTATESSSQSTSTEMAAASNLASGTAASGRALQVVFAENESKLPGNVDNDLGAIADQIKNSDDLRVQLLAYAGGEGLSASKARRLSLSRALSVRSFFIENGVRSTRIDVRALGDKTDEQPINRVDINIVER